MKGKLIVIESGTDSSGKETQSKLLKNRLENDGYDVIRITFPDYESKSSELVKMYLNGDFGENANDVNPYTASTFYAVDRFASYKMKWKNFLDKGGVVIADRYTSSNMVHQAAKFNNENDKNIFLEWLYDLEFNKMGLPKPDETIFLDMDIKASLWLMSLRKNKINGSNKKDIHESDKKYMTDSYENAKWIAKKYNWNIVKCTFEENIKSIEEIHEIVYNKVISIVK
ncbi:dTMP kinase [Helicovermis profundi]|uniref:Thymidylate kinase n=1 Tax=Helicovermis profundi TaxID=3065157 RepID=A0AAU9EKG3_9FIRM|nr:thymidylate kinase [Clostridia bacterium S502]